LFKNFAISSNSKTLSKLLISTFDFDAKVDNRKRASETSFIASV